MRTLNWNNTGWFEKNFTFTKEQQVVGQLSFSNVWSFNATYSDEHTQLNFAQKSFWDRDVLVTKHGETIGEINNGVFGEKTLKLVTGERFFMSTSLWEQEVYWKTEKGETIIQYQQALMSSMKKGSISFKESLPIDTEALLISSGLFIRKMTRRRRMRTMIVMILAITAGNQF